MNVRGQHYSTSKRTHAQPLSSRRDERFPRSTILKRTMNVLLQTMGGRITFEQMGDWLVQIFPERKMKWIMRDTEPDEQKSWSRTKLCSRVDHFLSLEARAGLIWDYQRDQERIAHETRRLKEKGMRDEKLQRKIESLQASALRPGEYEYRIARNGSHNEFKFLRPKAVSVELLKRVIKIKELT